MTDKETVIVVEAKTTKPMTFDGDQFCYVGSINLVSTTKKRHFAEIYERGHALELIEQSDIFRRQNRMSKTEYRLIPVKLSDKIRRKEILKKLVT